MEYAQAYTWEASSSPIDGVTVKDAPPTLCQALVVKGAPLSFDATGVRPKADGSPIAPGGRNTAAASLAGQYLQAGMSLHAIKRLLDSWNATNPEPLSQDELNTTLASVVRGHATRHPALPVRVASVTIEEDTERVPAHADTEAPAELLDPPGVLGDLLRYSLDTAPRPQPLFALAAALSLAGLALGRTLATDTGLRTNLYLVAVAPTGSGKEHGRAVIKHLVHAAGLDALLGGEELASGQGLLTRVSLTPNVLFQLDEFGLLMQAVQQPNAGTHQAAILTNLIKLFSATSSVYHGTEYADQVYRSRRDIPYPCVHLHATTTPETFWSALTGTHIVSGYLNRLLVVESRLARPARQHTQLGTPPSGILDWLKAARNAHQGLVGLSPETPTVASSTRAAAARLAAFDRAADDRAEAAKLKTLDALWARAFEHAAKVSLVCAGALDPAAPVIDERCVQYAIAFVTWCLEQTRQQVEGQVAASPFERACQGVAAVIR